MVHMSRRKRNRQVAKELENQAVHNVEPVNEHKDINESERIQRAESVSYTHLLHWRLLRFA